MLPGAQRREAGLAAWDSGQRLRIAGRSWTWWPGWKRLRLLHRGDRVCCGERHGRLPKESGGERVCSEELGGKILVQGKAQHLGSPGGTREPHRLDGSRAGETQDNVCASRGGIWTDRGAGDSRPWARGGPSSAQERESLEPGRLGQCLGKERPC